MGIFFSETVQSDDIFFFGENGEEALVENGDTYSTAVDDEHDLDLIIEQNQGIYGCFECGVVCIYRDVLGG